MCFSTALAPQTTRPAPAGIALATIFLTALNHQLYTRVEITKCRDSAHYSLPVCEVGRRRWPPRGSSSPDHPR